MNLSENYIKNFYRLIGQKELLKESDISNIEQFQFKKGEWDAYKSDDIRVVKNKRGGYGYYYESDPSKRVHSIGSASAESQKVFNDFYVYLTEELDIHPKDIYYGGKEKREFYIFDEQENKPIWYDFVITGDRNIIIEFHGETFHPNKEKLTDIEWLEWKYPKDGRSADEVYKEDKRKQELAEENGFQYHTIWAEDDVKGNLNKLKSIVN